MALVCLTSLAAAEAAADCQLSIGSQGRWYTDDDRGLADYDALLSVASELECDQRYSDTVSLGTKLFARADQHGSSRSHADIRELAFTFTSEPWQVRVGIDQVFWGVTEFSHIVDVINQSDILEDPLGETKLGQPMASASLRQSWGTISLIAMPWFRERTFPDAGERLRPAPPLPFGSALFESDSGREHFDWAMRYSHVIGPLDIGVSYFDGTGRDPALVFLPDVWGRIEMHPYYQQIRQVGLDAQLTFGEWLLKFEGASQHTVRGDYGGYVFGLEYAMIGFAGTVADVTAVFEYARDRREPAPVPGFLQNDWSVGLRLALNDSRTTEATLGAIIDSQLHSEAWSLEVASRLGEHWRLTAEARAFRHVKGTDPLRALREDSYVDLALTRYF